MDEEPGDIYNLDKTGVEVFSGGILVNVTVDLRKNMGQIIIS